MYVVRCSEVSGGPLVIGQVSSINRNASNSGQLASTSYSLSPDNVPQTFLITSQISVTGDFPQFSVDQFLVLIRLLPALDTAGFKLKQPSNFYLQPNSKIKFNHDFPWHASRLEKQRFSMFFVKVKV